ncbi:serine/arginine repetitive matrix protein 1-like [Cyprinodon tularosa]|uniref:serine/arginine repetitive matrix protein 1-like n=1 Tax=Cyprinodon tularosa TaxID=77115 RepID=UPI0018E22E2F|nr:serine/arginine repetitive matrix protein 1-like [Cyprinodon tularosa]
MTMVKKTQASAAAEEKLLSGKDQVKGLQTPAAAVENETSPVPQTLNDGPIPDEPCTQIFTVQGFSLVDYPDSDEPDEDDVMNKPPSPHLDVVLRQNDIGSDVSDHLYDSDETVVIETCDEASPSNHSNKQSNDELVPPLRRTKSILSKSKPSEKGSKSSRESGSESSRQSKSKPSEKGSKSSRESGSESSRQSKSKPSESGSKTSRQTKSKPSESGSKTSRQTKSKPSESGSKTSTQTKSKLSESGSKTSTQTKEDCPENVKTP